MSDQPTRKQPVWLPFAVVGGAVIIVMILWAALSSPENRPARDSVRDTFTLNGTIVVPARADTFVPDGGCIGDRGLSDIQPGTAVTVHSTSGKLLATGSLESGRTESTRCAYAFSVQGVPLGEGTYQVEVAGRGRVAFDEATAVSVGASLTLG